MTDFLSFTTYSQNLTSDSTKFSNEDIMNSSRTKNNPFYRLSNILKYNFKNEELLRQALTRQSAIGERNPKASDSNYERFEYFGDSILNFVITEMVYEVFPEKSEEYLTPIRSDIVKNETLGDLGKNLKLGEFLIIGRGEEKQKSRENKNILADIIEAIIAAIYIDSNRDISLVKSFILFHFRKIILSKLDKKNNNEIRRIENYLENNICKDYFNDTDISLEKEYSIDDDKISNFAEIPEELFISSKGKNKKKPKKLKNDLNRSVNNKKIKNLIEEFRCNIDNKQLFKIQNFTNITKSITFPFLCDYLLRKIHINKEDDFTNEDKEEYSKNFEQILKTKLNNFELKDFFILSQYFESAGYLICPDNNFLIAKLAYFKGLSFYLFGYYEEAEKIANESIEALESLNQINHREKNFIMIMAYILKINSKIKLLEQQKILAEIDKTKNINKMKNNHFYDVVNVSLYEIEELMNNIKNFHLEENQEIMFYYYAMKIKFLNFQKENDLSLNYLKEIKEQIKGNLLIFQDYFEKITGLPYLSIRNQDDKFENIIHYTNIPKLIVNEYVNIELIDLKMFDTKEFKEKLALIKSNISQYSCITTKEKTSKYNILFLELINFEMDEKIKEWNNNECEDIYEFYKISKNAFNIIKTNIGCISGHYDLWSLKINTIRKFIFYFDGAEEESENIDSTFDN